MDVSLLFTAAFYLAVIVAVLAIVIVIGVQWTVLQPAPTAGTSTVLPNGMRIRQWTEFETKFLYEEIWGSDNAYSKGGIQFREGAKIIDCGANVGMFSLYAAARCRGDATIVSFEPIPSTFQVLAANANAANAGAFNAIYKPHKGAKLKIVPLNVGVSNAPVPQITFQHHPHLSIWSTSDEGLANERVERICDDLVSGFAASPNLIARSVPSFFLRWVLKTLLVRKFAATVPVAAKLERLGRMIDRHLPAAGAAMSGTGAGRHYTCAIPDIIDLLKVDVEGAEIAVLEGIEEHQWRRIQQVVLEVESFAAVASVRSILESHGFEVTSIASEREKNPAGRSEVSMVYAIRPTYSRLLHWIGAHVDGAGLADAPAAAAADGGVEVASADAAAGTSSTSATKGKVPSSSSSWARSAAGTRAPSSGSDRIPTYAPEFVALDDADDDADGAGSSGGGSENAGDSDEDEDDGVGTGYSGVAAAPIAIPRGVVVPQQQYKARRPSVASTATATTATTSNNISSSSSSSGASPSSAIKAGARPQKAQLTAASPSRAFAAAAAAASPSALPSSALKRVPSLSLADAKAAAAAAQQARLAERVATLQQQHGAAGHGAASIASPAPAAASSSRGRSGSKSGALAQAPATPAQAPPSAGRTRASSSTASGGRRA